MKLLANENIPKPLIKKLSEQGIDVIWIPRTEYRGLKDEEVVSLANTLNRTILTRDLDFMRKPLLSKATYGVIYIAEPITRENLESISANIKNVIDHTKPEKGSEEIDVDGVEARGLTREAEVVAVVTHAIYKEHMYLLSDYYVVREWLNGRALSLAYELNVVDSLEIAVTLNKLIERGFIETPYKLPLPRTMVTLINRFTKDPYFRGTFLNLLRNLARERTPRAIVSRLRRKSY